MGAKNVLLLLLALVTVAFITTWWRALSSAPRERPEDIPGSPSPLQLGIGFVTNFFDTLGIGSYAPTTAVFRMKQVVPDERIPGTLTIGHLLPTITQAFIYISIIQVDVTTLIALIASSVVGSWLGAGVVCRWSRRKVQLGMGFALFVAALLFVMKNLDEMRGTPLLAGGTALELHGLLLGVAVAGNFVLGALMTLGIGLYAPCLIMISLLGMSPAAAFPIMMGSCAFLMPVAGFKFLSARSYSPKPALGLALGGIPAVLIAALIVKSLPLVYVRWLVVIVVLYTAVTMLRAGMAGARSPEPVTTAGD